MLRVRSRSPTFPRSAVHVPSLALCGSPVAVRVHGGPVMHFCTVHRSQPVPCFSHACLPRAHALPRACHLSLGAALSVALVCSCDAHRSFSLACLNSARSCELCMSCPRAHAADLQRSSLWHACSSFCFAHARCAFTFETSIQALFLAFHVSPRNGRCARITLSHGVARRAR